MRPALLTILLLSLLVWATPRIVERVPPRLLPWVELSLDDPPGLVRDWKLARAAGDPARCLAVLDAAGVGYEPVPDRDTGPGCGFRNAVRLGALGELRFDPLPLSCRAALSFAVWERHSLQPAARDAYDVPVTRLEHFGSYACRAIRGRADERRSSHAMADAIDVAGFVLADGKRLRVARDHPLTARTPDERDAAFLARVEAEACRSFPLVLGPGYNAAHRDHFHLERAGSFRLCAPLRSRTKESPAAPRQ